MPRHSLLTVHAHPDDETIGTGGVMARYSGAGDRVICVTCTGGEEGEIVVPEMDTPENHERLGAIRAEELRLALEALGPIESRSLGYRDSGMMGTPANDADGNLWSADVDEAAGRLVRIVRELRPQVIVSYNAFGGYGHPDHIRAAQLAVLAFERAGDAAWYPDHIADGLEPWQPLKRYELVMDIGRRQGLIERLEQRGVRTWMTPDPDETEEQRQEREAFIARMADAQGPKTTSVDISAQVERKLAALRAHVTQIRTTDFFLAMTPDEWREFAPTEDFTLAESRIGVRIPEDDLFAGVPFED
jgi:N-acetyl-1-D-myo-inositol-2-amino-2-deoxy-alpha-D-glucopyranoside deacetylase